MLNIVVLVSGGGTNLQALIDAQKKGEITGGKISCVISSNPDAYALERAKENGIPSIIVSKKDYANNDSYGEALAIALDEVNADIIVLAGFMSILSKSLTDKYQYRILNVHPSLIPSFCGDGFYGLKVHEAALACGVKVTGATVHFVNEVADAGAIILQKAVDVKRSDTPETLQKRVMEEAEWKILPRAVSLLCEGKIEVINGRAYIIE
ncbi:MAG: phosphoribosylglycinamide formyltransferase [Clostridiales bacterium]|nr:phosphoribosylglycinamide formyltransferase [Clostridiales bacterium]